jgi:hypothetical protein
MKNRSIGLSTLTLIISELAMAGMVGATAIPQFNYICGANIKVHADRGGPVFIDGKEARLKKINDNYYEATRGGVTISIAFNPDKTLNMSYTGSNRASGICSDSSSSTSRNPETSASRSPAESACLNAVAKKTGVSQGQLSIVDVSTAEAGIGVTIRVPNADAPWSCLADKKGRVQGVTYTGSEGRL